MQPWQEVADVASLPGSYHSPLHFLEDDLYEQKGGSVGSFDDEQMRLTTMPENFCADDYWYGHGLCIPNAPNKNDVDAMDDTPLHFFEGFLETNMESHADASSSACRSSLHTCQTSAAVIDGVSSTTSFIHPSPVFSECSSLPGDQPCINNHACAHPGVNVHMYTEPINSIEASYPWALAYDNEYATKSYNYASTTASFDDNLFDGDGDGDVSSLAPNASPPSYELNVGGDPSQNFYELNVGGDPSQNFAARTIVPQQFHLEQSNHQRGAIRPGQAQESQDSVSFLIENGTTTIADGYVWRKYGQKKIKDKIHPRSYFRCAQPACPIKKQTESSSDIRGSVLITYFGKHNHPV